MRSSQQPAVLVAAAASIAAGLVHAAASGSHAELATLSMLFAVTALAQIGWGAAALVRPTRPVLVAGIGIHLVALGAWVSTRTVGISSIEGLEGGQAIAFQDGLVAGLQVVAVLGVGLALTSVTLPRIARAAVPVLVVALAVATVPAMAQPHGHGSLDHDVADVATGEVAAAGAGHADDDDHVHDDSHDHGDGDDRHGTDDHHGTDAAAEPAEPAEVASPTAGSGCVLDPQTPAAAPAPAPDHVDPEDTPDHGH